MCEGKRTSHQTAVAKKLQRKETIRRLLRQYRMSEEKSLDSIFHKKYAEFCDDLIETYPEKMNEIVSARRLSESQRIERFRSEVLPTAGSPTRNPSDCPGPVLPGVVIEDVHWNTFSENTKKAIYEYVRLLCFTSMFGDPSNPWMNDLSGNGPAKQWMNEMLNQWKDKLSKVDFKSLSEKMMGLFGSGTSGFKLPEQFLKGQLAKLAEELVREFKPEDFGLDAAELGDTDANPGRAFEMLMNIYTQRPEILQNAMKRIAKRLQDKIQRGELRPQELAAEAEEMIKQFTDNPAFVELMESFRSVFGFEDPEMARAAGRDSDGRRAIAQRRLRQERERRAQRRAEETVSQAQAQAQTQPVANLSVEELMQRMGLNSTPETKGPKEKQKRKK